MCAQGLIYLELMLIHLGGNFLFVRCLYTGNGAVGNRPRPDFGGNAGGGGKLFRVGAAVLLHGSLGMLGVRMYPCPHKVNCMTNCMHVFVNYDCTTHPILPFNTLLQSFFRKRSYKFREICQILTSFPFPRGGAKNLRGGAKRSQGRCAPYPHFPSKSGHGINRVLIFPGARFTEAR